MASHGLDFTRIRHLLNPDLLADKRVVQVGMGSGGAPVNQHLTMAGVRKWILFDPEIFDPINLVKHPGLRSQIGQPKVTMQHEWIIDRNPEAEVMTYQEDVIHNTRFISECNNASLVLCCVDTPGAREFVNKICVERGVPCVTGAVFRTGFGGDVYAYIPEKTGCYACMEYYCSIKGYTYSETEPELTEEEKERIYGQDDRNFQASGLSLDIAFITLIHARLALNILLDGQQTAIPQIKHNWMVFENRPLPGFKKYFTLPPQEECPIQCRSKK